MKVIKRNRIELGGKSKLSTRSLINELKVLKSVHHPNIVQFKEVVDDGKDK